MIVIVRRRVSEYSAGYAEEIEGIAQGAAVDPLDIYALNARSEILALPAQECTALCFPDARLLGQNWDWAQDLEELAVLMRIVRSDGHRILMLTEPGMIGKIGMNSAGAPESTLNPSLN